jgi:hypothetical protein
MLELKKRIRLPGRDEFGALGTRRYGLRKHVQ